jgi:uncharacterized protein (TIGR02266 family)
MGRRKWRPGEQRRAALDRPVALRFKHFEEFIEKLAANVSSGGMFIRTRRPHPVGSVFEFEFRLGSDRPLIAGKAQVAWVRRRDETAEKPAGMGVRFVELDDESRRHVAELVAARDEARGRADDAEPPLEVPAAAGKPTAAGSEATAAPPPAARAAGHAEPELPGGRAESAARRRLGGRLPALLMALVLAAALTAAFRWWPPSGAGSAADPPATPTPADRSPIAAEETDAAPTTPAAPGATAAPAARPAQLQRVDEWARAWSERRVDDYLAAYSGRFTPDGGLGRAAWERQRRSRILTPERIEVALALVELEELGPDSSRVRFIQAYESESYRDVVRKVLDLEREADGWKIVRESVED